MIMHDGGSLDYGHYVSDVLDTNTGIWWHCDDYEITEVRDFTEGVYNIESNKKNYREEKFLLKKIDVCLYQNK